MEISTKQTFSWSLEKILEKISEIALPLNELGDRETIKTAPGVVKSSDFVA